jgi:hypothetical protein
LCRPGKARISREVASILDRLGTSAEVWGQRIQRLLAKTWLLGSYFSAVSQRLRQLAQQRGVHHNRQRGGLDCLSPVIEPFIPASSST